jgi:hypothetical protein
LPIKEIDMRRAPNLKVEGFRISGPANTNYGAFVVLWRRTMLHVIASAGGGWDHVSVSLPDRCPTWEEMCRVTELFFHDDETVMQLRPPKSSYVNNHEFCLHLWRPQTAEEIAAERARWEADGDCWPFADLEPPSPIPLPPMSFVGVKGLEGLRGT